MNCGGNGPLTYHSFSDSFGAIYGPPATDNPCSVYVPVPFPLLAGAVHTHPLFTSPEQLLQGNGRQSPPATMDDVILWNNGGEYFSQDDSNVQQSLGRPFYVRTPTGRILRTDNHNPYDDPVQVHP